MAEQVTRIRTGSTWRFDELMRAAEEYRRAAERKVSDVAGLERGQVYTEGRDADGRRNLMLHNAEFGLTYYKVAADRFMAAAVAGTPEGGAVMAVDLAISCLTDAKALVPKLGDDHPRKGPELDALSAKLELLQEIKGALMDIGLRP